MADSKPWWHRLGDKVWWFLEKSDSLWTPTTWSKTVRRTMILTFPISMPLYLLTLIADRVLLALIVFVMVLVVGVGWIINMWTD